jgi:hypothetical protein
MKINNPAGVPILDRRTRRAEKYSDIAAEYNGDRCRYFQGNSGLWLPFGDGV